MDKKQPKNGSQSWYGWHGLSWTIMDYQGLSWTIMDYHGLSWTIMDYHGLSWTIMDTYLPTPSLYNTNNSLILFNCVPLLNQFFAPLNYKDILLYGKYALRLYCSILCKKMHYSSPLTKCHNIQSNPVLWYKAAEFKIIFLWTDESTFMSMSSVKSDLQFPAIGVKRGNESQIFQIFHSKWT